MSRYIRSFLLAAGLLAATMGAAYASGGGQAASWRKTVGAAQVSAHAFPTRVSPPKRGKRGPRGIPGPRGPKGATGIAGPAGAPGAAGAKGPTGTKGVTGAKGATGAAGPVAVKLDAEFGPGGERYFYVGPWELKVYCMEYGLDPDLEVRGRGPGAAQILGISTADDASPVVATRGQGLNPAVTPLLLSVTTSSGHYARQAGNIVLHDGTSVATIVYDAFADQRGSLHCRFTGTAVLAN